MLKILLALYWCLCAVLTHLPPSQVPSSSLPHADKLTHFTMYLLLGVLLRLNLKKGYWVFLILMGYAIADEMTQPFFQRDAEWGDGLADILGAALGTWWAGRRSSRR